MSTLKEVEVQVPDYVTTASMPYEVKVAEQIEGVFGTCSELTKVVRMNDEFNSPMEFLTTWYHEAVESAISECHCKIEHDDVDRVAHVCAEWTLCLLEAQE